MSRKKRYKNHKKKTKKQYFSVLDFHLPLSMLNLTWNIETNRSDCDTNDENYCVRLKNHLGLILAPGARHWCHVLGGEWDLWVAFKDDQFKFSTVNGLPFSFQSRTLTSTLPTSPLRWRLTYSLHLMRMWFETNAKFGKLFWKNIIKFSNGNNLKNMIPNKAYYIWLER